MMTISGTVGLCFLPQSLQASCGSTSCFLTVGNQPGAQPKDTVRVDLNYSHAPQKGPETRVAAVNLEKKEIILGEHQEFQTINQQLQLDVNYGLTDNLTLQVTLPVVFREHDHRIEVGVEPEAGLPKEGEGVFENFDTTGLGDIRVMGKYGFLPSLRSALVLAVGLDIPTGNDEARNSEGNIQEPSLQVGRGAVGVIGQLYQSYELIPHTLNQFLSYTYEHTFENNLDYQFGDRHFVSAGLIYQATRLVSLSGQVNFRHTEQDEFVSTLKQAGDPGAAGEVTLDDVLRNRGVPNTGSNYLFLTPGITVNLSDQSSWYFFGQIPLSRDANGGLEQDISILTGFVHFFSLQ